MRCYLFLTLLFPVWLSAQQPAAQYIDVVHLYEGDAVAGTIITYQYGERIILVQENGNTRELAWDEVKRVNFRLDKERAAALDQESPDAAIVEPVTKEENRRTPTRKFYHQLAGSASFGTQSNPNFDDFFFRNSRSVITGGLAYHVIKPINKFSIGAGVDLSLMNHRLQEKVLAGTLQADYRFGNGRLQPLIRLEGGITYPFGAGADGGEVTERSLSPMYHPSLGVLIGRNSGPWNKLVIDLGYRFLTNKFTLTDANLDVIERRVEYRRLILRAGIRF